MNATIDISGLNRRLSELQSVLTAAGSPGSMSQVVRNEGGQLAWDISQAIGPRTKAQGAKGIDRQIKLTTYTLHRSNLSTLQQFSGHEAFTWLYAAPGFLVGIGDNYDQRDASDAEVLATYKKERGKRFARWHELGKRGKQRVMTAYKHVITKKQKASLRRALMNKIGQARASFARTAATLAPAKRIPEWIRAQIGAVTKTGKSLLQVGGLSDATHPHFEFGSRAPGVESNPKMREKIQGAVKKRERITAEKVRKVLNGYVYQWNTGQVFRPPPNDQN